MDTLKSDIPSWLSSLQRPELLDQNNNSVPDPIEALLCISSAAPITPMLQSACSLDKDQNGIPDYCEDADSDGVPNAWDMDYRSDTDLDGDGVLNEQDIDANGDGVPDYAQKK